MPREYDHLYKAMGSAGASFESSPKLLPVAAAMSDPADQSAFLLDERAFYVGNAWAGVLVGTR